MDSQCDKCGKQLPTLGDLEVSEPNQYPGVYDEDEREIRIGFHIAVGSDNWISPNGTPDWDPDQEVDLCRECRTEFLKLWEAWYGK